MFEAKPMRQDAGVLGSRRNTGARMGELTQLRASDVFEQDGIWAIKISPEAGTVKNRKPRTVPLHEHLIKQGFVDFAKASGSGPLFYNKITSAPKVDDPTIPRALGPLRLESVWLHGFEIRG